MAAVKISREEVVAFVKKVMEEQGIDHMPTLRDLQDSYGSYSIVTAINRCGGINGLAGSMGISTAPIGKDYKQRNTDKWTKLLTEAKEQGLTITEIAIKNNSTTHTVQGRAEELGFSFPFSRHSKPKPDKEEFLKDWESVNGSIVHMSDLYGVWDNTIRVWGREYGVVGEPKSYAEREPIKWQGDLDGGEILLLAGAIVWKALNDYMEASTKHDYRMIQDCKSFFKSEWGHTLVDVLPQYVKNRIEVLGLGK